MPEDFTIERLGVRDAEALFLLLNWRRHGKDGAPHDMTDAELASHLAAMRAHLKSPSLLVWAARAEGKLVGYVSVAWMVKPDPREVFYVDELWVAPSCRRRGIGEALMRAAIEEARRRGIWRVRLVAARGPATRALYDKLGFRFLGGRFCELDPEEPPPSS